MMSVNAIFPVARTGDGSQSVESLDYTSFFQTKKVVVLLGPSLCLLRPGFGETCLSMPTPIPWSVMPDFHGLWIWTCFSRHDWCYS